MVSVNLDKEFIFMKVDSVKRKGLKKPQKYITVLGKGTHDYYDEYTAFITCEDDYVTDIDAAINFKGTDGNGIEYFLESTVEKYEAGASVVTDDDEYEEVLDDLFIDKDVSELDNPAEISHDLDDGYYIVYM